MSSPPLEKREVLVMLDGGRTALHHAAREGKSEAVKMLLEAGADKEAKDVVSVDGLHTHAWKPLGLASRFHHGL
eukprot:986293-Rhodomonas_salina.1